MHEDEFYRWLGQYLRSMRMEKRITQREVCLRFHLSRPSLSNIESGRHHLSVYDLYILVNLLNDPFERTLEKLKTAE